VDEVVQEALKTVFEKYGVTVFTTSFSAWAYKVLVNKLQTHVATEGRRARKMADINAAAELTSSARPDCDLEQRLLHCLEQVNRVHPRHARILNLHYQGFLPAEICTRLRVTKTNFYTILSRARDLIEACLEKGEVK